MTETDLRFAFHMDTGSLPFWSEDKWQRKDYTPGHPTSEYGRWLEEKAGNARWLQRAYQFEHQIAPTYKTKHKKKRRWCYIWYSMEVYDKHYIYWLEERILNKKPEVVTEIIHI